MRFKIIGFGFLVLFLFSAFSVSAQRRHRRRAPVKKHVPVKAPVPPKVVPMPLLAIKEADLRTDLFALADNHFRGREAGTLDEMKASVWLADQARAAGLKPAGDDGTYFQFFNIRRNRLSPNTRIQVGDSTFQLWQSALIAQTAPGEANAPIIYLGKEDWDNLNTVDLQGKAAAIQVDEEGINLQVSLAERRYPSLVMRKYSAELIKRGAAAIIFIADARAEKSWNQVVPQLKRGLYDLEDGPNAVLTTKLPIFWVHNLAQTFLQTPNLQLNAKIEIEQFDYPSVNIVGKIIGNDPILSKEYVVFSGHQDHDGIRYAYDQDSIYNGADDNATVAVALLAIARAFKEQSGKRSAIFVWHGAEERGLLGSKWFSAHPTVPKKSLVAVLNADMIGRNAPDSAALLGAQSPHRNSQDLVNMALEANKEGTQFKLDTLWDQPNHVEGWYFRSDHLPYARAGIPAIFFTTLLHPDYHTPRDEASRIDIRKLTQMTLWMYRTGAKVANSILRPKLDPNFKLER
jgi:hypothetical protein